MPDLGPPDSHFLNAATGWLMLGNAEEARREFEQMRAEARAHPDAQEFQWSWFAHEKRWEDAVDVAQCLVDQCSKRANAWIHRSFALHELGRTQEAFDLLLPAFKKFPKEITIPYNLACYATQLRDLEAGRRWFQKVLVLGKTSEEKLRGLHTALEDADLEPLWPEFRRQLEDFESGLHS